MEKENNYERVCRYCTDQTCGHPNNKDEGFICTGTKNSVKHCNFRDMLSSPLDVYTVDKRVEMIRNEALEIEQYLVTVTNMDDIMYGLRFNSSVCLIGALINYGESKKSACYEEFICSPLRCDIESGTKVNNIRLEHFGEHLIHPTYDYNEKKLYFDIFDDSLDDDCAILENCTLDNFEEGYKEVAKRAIEEYEEALRKEGDD